MGIYKYAYNYILGRGVKVDDSKIISRRVKMTENTSLVRLGIFDQLKLILAQFTSSESKELDALEKVSTLEYRKISSLTNFFEESIRRMKDAGKKSVMIRVESEFLPYLDRVIDKRYGMGRYYNFKVFKKDYNIRVKYNFYVEISKKES